MTTVRGHKVTQSRNEWQLGKHLTVYITTAGIKGCFGNFIVLSIFIIFLGQPPSEISHRTGTKVTASSCASQNGAVPCVLSTVQGILPLNS